MVNRSLSSNPAASSAAIPTSAYAVTDTSLPTNIVKSTISLLTTTVSTHVSVNLSIDAYIQNNAIT